MTPEEIFTQLQRGGQPLPEEALRAADQNRDALTPSLLASLSQLVANSRTVQDDQDLQLPFYAMYLLAAWREPKAHPLLLDFLRLPGELALDASGDIITEDMDRMLAQTYGGDVQGLLALVRDPAVNEFSRGAALRSLALLVTWGQMPRETVITHFRETVAALPAGDPILTQVVGLAPSLHLAELRDELLALYDTDQIDETVFGDRDELAAEFEDPSDRYFRSPIEDVANEEGWWAGSTEEDPIAAGAWDEPEEAPITAGDNGDAWSELPSNVTPGLPYRAPPKPGRNDPCPCGSGKKYKKCCGA